MPFRAFAPSAADIGITFQEDLRTGFAVAEIPARPVMVGDDVAGWDAEFVREIRGEPGGTVDCGGLTAGIAEFADFNGDAEPVARPAIVRVVALFRREQVLDGFAVIDREVPGHPAGPPEPPVAAAFACVSEITDMRVRGPADVLGGVDCDVLRVHRPLDEAAVDIWGQEGLADPAGRAVLGSGASGEDG